LHIRKENLLPTLSLHDFVEKFLEEKDKINDNPSKKKQIKHG